MMAAEDRTEPLAKPARWRTPGMEDMRIVRGTRAGYAPARAKEGRLMRHYRGEVRIEASPEQVWAILVDKSRLREWTPRSEFTEFSGPLDQVGTTYSDTTRLMGFGFKMTNEVVEVEPPRLYHEQSDDGPIDTVIRLEPDGDATRLLVECDYEIPGRLPGFLKDLIDGRMSQRFPRQMMRDLKALAEAEAPARA